MKRGKGKFEIHVVTKVEVRENPRAFEQLLQLMRLAIEMADKPEEEARRLERIWIDNI